MGDDLVVLWEDHDASHDVTWEVVQIGEGTFELRILCNGRLWLEEESADLDTLLERARQLRADLHPVW